MRESVDPLGWSLLKAPDRCRRPLNLTKGEVSDMHAAIFVMALSKVNNEGMTPEKLAVTQNNKRLLGVLEL